MKKLPLGVRFFLIFLLVIVIPGLILGILTRLSLEQKMMEQVEDGNHKMSILFTNSLNYYVEEMEQTTLTPYLNTDVLKLLRQIKQGGQGRNAAMNRLALDMPGMFISANKKIHAIGFQFKEEALVHMEKDAEVQLYTDYNNEDYISWTDSMLESDQHLFYEGEEHPRLFENYKSLSVRRIIKDYHSNEPLAVMYAEIDTLNLDNLISDLGVGKERIVQVIDGHKVIYSSLEKPYKSVDYMAYRTNTYSCDNGWQVEILTPKTLVSEQVKEIMSIYTYSFIFFIILVSLMYMVMIRKVAKPFNSLLRQIEEIDGDNFQEINIHTNIKEVTILQDKLNQMQSKVREYIQREYTYKIAEKNAQYQALQAQINPHFLYNTFNGFLTLNRLGEKVILKNSMMALIKMMRYVFKKQQLTTVGDELYFIEQYLYLSKMRFEDKLTFSISIDPSICNGVIPRLSLQPIVENAIVHGLEPSLGSCSISVQVTGIMSPFRKGESYMHIGITDTGMGFDRQEWDYVKGEGLDNVRQRLEFLYADTLFLINSEEEVGTRVDMVLPYKPYEGEK